MVRLLQPHKVVGCGWDNDSPVCCRPYVQNNPMIQSTIFSVIGRTTCGELMYIWKWNPKPHMNVPFHIHAFVTKNIRISILLKMVTCSHEKPYNFVSRYPNNAVVKMPTLFLWAQWCCPIKRKLRVRIILFTELIISSTTFHLMKNDIRLWYLRVMTFKVLVRRALGFFIDMNTNRQKCKDTDLHKLVGEGVGLFCCICSISVKLPFCLNKISI